MSITTDRKALELAMANINKNYGANSVILGKAAIPEMEIIPTGIFKLDAILGRGGLPKGRIVHVYGPESSGKSLMAFNVIAQCQAQGGLCAYIDAEHDVDPSWMEFQGVDRDELVFSQPETGEEAFNILRELTRSGVFDFIVVDSVAALTPKAEFEGDMEDNHVGLQARMIGQGLRINRSHIAENNTCVMFINQLRSNIGPGMSANVAPGGRALKFYSSIEIELKKVQDLKNSAGTESIGTRIKALVKKNKVGNPMRAVEYDMIHGKGIDNYRSILEMAVRSGLIHKSGNWFYTDSTKEKSIGNGITQASENLASDLDYTNELKEKILAELG